VSVVDLHPENLLDKEIRGELDGPERQRLEAHLAQCATCRFERQLRGDFALDLSRDSVPPEIAGLVDGLARRSPEPLRLGAIPRRGRRVKVVVLTAAATLTLVVGAFASTEAGRRVIAPLFEGRPSVTSPSGDATRGTASAAARAATVSPSALLAPSGLSPSVEPPLEPLARSWKAHPLSASEPRSPAAAPPDGPARLFDEETDARRKGDTARMLEMHAQLVAHYPRSHEAQVSRMMVARLLLDRSDPGGALSGFDAYLRAGSGELREDALAGRAAALDRMGRTDEGRLAWMALLDQYPNTAYGTHARTRVEASGGN
jgi:hypothetical protein